MRMITAAISISPIRMGRLYDVGIAWIERREPLTLPVLTGDTRAVTRTGGHKSPPATEADTDKPWRREGVIICP
jgi:hypothetical protein